MATSSAFSGGRSLLEIDGAAVGTLKRFGGLGMEADIAVMGSATDSMPKKHVSNIKWTPGKATVGVGMGKGLCDWVKASMDKGSSPRSGSFKLADFNYHVKSSLTFSNALITEVTVPKLDGSSKEAGFFDIGFEAERVVWAKGNDEDIRNRIDARPKAWLCSNFKLRIGDLPCARVAAVDSFSWRCAITSDLDGAGRPGANRAARVTVPDLRLSISAADYAAWADAAKKWFVDGAHLEANEMSGRITLLGPTMKDADEIGSIELVNVGFKKFSPPDAAANGDQVERFTVELYVEKMLFNLKEYGG